MSVFDEAYDKMNLREVCFRIPGELAISALKRRIINLDTLENFIDTVGTKTNSVKELKNHINKILNNYTSNEILSKFKNKNQTLFGWLSDENKERLKNESSNEIDLKFLFNMTKEKDLEGLSKILDLIISKEQPKSSEIISILHKADTSVFLQLANKVLRDKRPEVRCCILAIGTVAKQKMVGENSLVVGLKALAKTNFEKTRVTDTLDFNLFTQLRPEERLIALEKYLNQYPEYCHISPFTKCLLEEEVNLVLFAGCLELNDKVIELKEKYNKIVNLDKPKEEDEEEDEDEDGDN